MDQEIKIKIDYHNENRDSFSSGSVLSVDADVEFKIESILRIFNALSTAKDLKPSSFIDELFQELVGICIQTLNATKMNMILQDPRILHIKSSLRTICAQAESHLESHWAAIIASGSDSKNASDLLTSFPYHQNYMDLTHMELNAIQTVNPSPPRKIAFIGSGPLPLTSLCLCDILNPRPKWQSFLASYFSTSTFVTPWTTVLNIDHDPTATAQSGDLCRKLGERANGMEFLCEDAGRMERGLEEFDVVYLAALVGESQVEKERVLIDVVRRMRVGALVVIRTVHSLRSLLYPEFDVTTDAVMACVDVCLIVHPYNYIVNSAIIARVRKRDI